jgi:hypothetical protein
MHNGGKIGLHQPSGYTHNNAPASVPTAKTDGKPEPRTPSDNREARPLRSGLVFEDTPSDASMPLRALAMAVRGVLGQLANAADLVDNDAANQGLLRTLENLMDALTTNFSRPSSLARCLDGAEPNEQAQGLLSALSILHKGLCALQKRHRDQGHQGTELVHCAVEWLDWARLVDTKLSAAEAATIAGRALSRLRESRLVFEARDDVKWYHPIAEHALSLANRVSSQLHIPLQQLVAPSSTEPQNSIPLATLLQDRPLRVPGLYMEGAGVRNPHISFLEPDRKIDSLEALKKYVFALDAFSDALKDSTPASDEPLHVFFQSARQDYRIRLYNVLGPDVSQNFQELERELAAFDQLRHIKLDETVSMRRLDLRTLDIFSGEVSEALYALEVWGCKAITDETGPLGAEGELRTFLQPIDKLPRLMIWSTANNPNQSTSRYLRMHSHQEIVHYLWALRSSLLGCRALRMNAQATQELKATMNAQIKTANDELDSQSRSLLSADIRSRLEKIETLERRIQQGERSGKKSLRAQESRLIELFSEFHNQYDTHSQKLSLPISDLAPVQMTQRDLQASVAASLSLLDSAQHALASRTHDLYTRRSKSDAYREARWLHHEISWFLKTAHQVLEELDSAKSGSFPIELPDPWATTDIPWPSDRRQGWLDQEWLEDGLTKWMDTTVPDEGVKTIPIADADALAAFLATLWLGATTLAQATTRYAHPERIESSSAMDVWRATAQEHRQSSDGIRMLHQANQPAQISDLSWMSQPLGDSLDLQPLEKALAELALALGALTESTLERLRGADKQLITEVIIAFTRSPSDPLPEIRLPSWASSNLARQKTSSSVPGEFVLDLRALTEAQVPIVKRQVDQLTEVVLAAANPPTRIGAIGAWLQARLPR